MCFFFLFSSHQHLPKMDFYFSNLRHPILQTHTPFTHTGLIQERSKRTPRLLLLSPAFFTRFDTQRCSARGHADKNTPLFEPPSPLIPCAVGIDFFSFSDLMLIILHVFLVAPCLLRFLSPCIWAQLIRARDRCSHELDSAASVDRVEEREEERERGIKKEGRGYL